MWNKICLKEASFSRKSILKTRLVSAHVTKTQQKLSVNMVQLCTKRMLVQKYVVEKNNFFLK